MPPAQGQMLASPVGKEGDGMFLRCGGFCRGRGFVWQEGGFFRGGGPSQVRRKGRVCCMQPSRRGRNGTGRCLEEADKAKGSPEAALYVKAGRGETPVKISWDKKWKTHCNATSKNC